MTPIDYERETMSNLIAELERLNAAAAPQHLKGCVHYFPERPDGEDWLEQRFDFYEDEPCTCGIHARQKFRHLLPQIIKMLRAGEELREVADADQWDKFRIPTHNLSKLRRALAAYDLAKEGGE